MLIQETRNLLLVEDNVADADLVEEMLATTYGEQYAVVRVQLLSDAIDRVKTTKFDAMLLDLRLPDATGVESVQSFRRVAEDVPIIVLTGSEDEELALACIGAGAQDYLCKNEMKPIVLRRTIGYSISRLRESQIRQLEALLGNYRQMSTVGASTPVTAIGVGAGPIKQRLPAEFDSLTEDYRDLVNEYLDQLITRKHKPRDIMEMLATRLGEFGAGPRDLVDVHLAALESAAEGRNYERVRALTLESRLLALEMMGLLVDFYRVGFRRLYRDEKRS